VLVAVLIIVVIAGGADGSSSTPGQVPGVPDVMLTAYRQAAQRIGGIRPACVGMRWSILAGIAEVESRHASGRTIAPNGDISPPILGPPLDGSGVGGNRTPIRNSDGTFARAVGPFQFLTPPGPASNKTATTTAPATRTTPSTPLSARRSTCAETVPET
jgi:hypothetical protein